MRRCCNGCGRVVGDVLESEIEAAVAGRALPDVRGECSWCVAVAAVQEAAREDLDGLVYGALRRLGLVIVCKCPWADGRCYALGGLDELCPYCRRWHQLAPPLTADPVKAGR